MRFIKHTANHLLIHLALFSGFAILVPVMTQSFEKSLAPWAVSSSIFSAGMMLILVSVIMLYKVKETVPDTLLSAGTTIFLPGALSLVSGIVNFHAFEDSSITGLAVIQPIADFYVHHSVPTVLSVAAVYMFIGGILYWVGHMFQKVKDRNPFSQ